jgi:dolichol kinase
MNQDAAAAFTLAAIGAFMLMAMLVVLAINVVVCAILYGCFKRIPAEHRKLEAGLVWLLLIPCFSIVWNFFVFPRLAQSYQSYFRAAGREDLGDCGAGFGWAYAGCVLGACLPLPFLPFGIGLAALVLLVVFLVKATQLKNLIPAA